MTDKIEPVAWQGEHGELCATKPNIVTQTLYTADQVKELTERLDGAECRVIELTMTQEALNGKIDLVEAQRNAAKAALAEARKVIEPFAKRAGMLDGIWRDHETHWRPECGNTTITVGNLRAASRWLQANKGDA
jgi:hypothetical protein